MKKYLSVLLALAFAVGAFAQAPVSTISFLGSNPTFKPDGSLISAPVQAMFQNVVTVAGVNYSTTTSVAWDGTSTTNTVTLGNVTVTYQWLTLATALVATQEKAAAPGTQAAAANATKASAPKPQ